MNIKLKEECPRKASVGDIIVTNDDKVYIISRIAHGIAKNTYGLYDLQYSKLLQYDWAILNEFIEHLKDVYGIKKIIPGEKLTLLEE